MGGDVSKYEVVSGCYVPVGSGFRYKLPGQIVTLGDEHAAALAENIKPVDPIKGVAKRNTKPKAVEQPVVSDWYAPEEVVEFSEGVALDVGDSQTNHE